MTKSIPTTAVLLARTAGDDQILIVSLSRLVPRLALREIAEEPEPRIPSQSPCKRSRRAATSFSSFGSKVFTLYANKARG